MSVYVMVVIIVIVTSLGDYLLKTSSAEVNPYTNYYAHLGAFLYAICAYGWVYIMRRENLMVVGVIYSSATLLILAVLSIVIFKETVTPKQLLAVACALAAILLTLE